MNLRRLGLVALCVGALSLSAGNEASAATLKSESSSSVQSTAAAKPPRTSISKQEYEAAFAQFEASSAPRDSVIVDGMRIVTYHVASNFSLSMADPTPIATPTGEVTPQLSAGRTKYGYYFGFNQFDQNVLSNSAAAAAITAAICAIPGVGWAACVVAGIAVSVAVSYIHRNGVCTRNRTLYWYDVKGGSTIGCLSSPPS